MIAAGDLDDATPRLTHFRPRFAKAAAPDPGSRDWREWEALLADDGSAGADGPEGAMRFQTAHGFATVSSALIALPAAIASGTPPVFRFRAWQPTAEPWRDVAVG